MLGCIIPLKCNLFYPILPLCKLWPPLWPPLLTPFTHPHLPQGSAAMKSTCLFPLPTPNDTSATFVDTTWYLLPGTRYQVPDTARVQYTIQNMPVCMYLRMYSCMMMHKNTIHPCIFVFWIYTGMYLLQWCSYMAIVQI